MADFQWYRAYDKLNESVYIVDAETYEILYVNERIQSKFQGDALGKYCYAHFCNRTTPCDYCSSACKLEELPSNEFYKIDRYNPVLDIFITVNERIVDWEDGRKARLCIAIDISQKAKTETMVDWQHAFLEQSDNYLACFDTDYYVVYANPAMCDLMGWSVGDDAKGDFLS
ncbi:PAS domain-containing protein, partial [Anaerosporobacter sp.]|uniref:PAS domain-containing protein n=1 Tax=Anaerosporobacter sp. TaxID=1872529 RepID=UPI00286F646B